MAATIVLAQQVQQGFVYGSVVATPSNAASVQLTGVMNGSDVTAGQPSQRQLTLYLELSWDNGLTYEPVAQEPWTSGPGDVAKGGTTPTPPGLGTNVPQNPMPSFYRGSLNVPASTSVGLSLSFFDSSGNLI